LYDEEVMSEMYGEELDAMYGEEMMNEMYGEEMYGEEDPLPPVEVTLNLELVLPENTDSQALLDSISGATVTQNTMENGMEYEMYGDELSGAEPEPEVPESTTPLLDELYGAEEDEEEVEA
jgi:hypothetical protein